jgi:hypothetical protein
VSDEIEPSRVFGICDIVTSLSADGIDDKKGLCSFNDKPIA